MTEFEDAYVFSRYDSMGFDGNSGTDLGDALTAYVVAAVALNINQSC